MLDFLRALSVNQSLWKDFVFTYLSFLDSFESDALDVFVEMMHEPCAVFNMFFDEMIRVMDVLGTDVLHGVHDIAYGLNESRLTTDIDSLFKPLRMTLTVQSCFSESCWTSLSPRNCVPPDSAYAEDLLQVVVLFALAWIDCHELELTGDLLSIDIRNLKHELFVGVCGSDVGEYLLKVFDLIELHFAYSLHKLDHVDLDILLRRLELLKVCSCNEILYTRAGPRLPICEDGIPRNGIAV
ncbi:hypothetical protein Tco_0097554 [Tanacetum coccineum]